MHLEIEREKPGKCLKCGMNLITKDSTLKIEAGNSSVIVVDSTIKY